MNKFPVFDLDGTLYNTHLGVELLRKLSDLNAIPRISQQEFSKRCQEWAGSNDRTDYYNEHLDVYYNEHLKGVSEALFHKACRIIAKEAFEPSLAARYNSVMNKLIHAVLIIGFLVVDFLFFHDLFKPGEVTTLPQYLTGLLSLLVFAVSARTLQQSSSKNS